jgi:hypothetical protein
MCGLLSNYRAISMNCGQARYWSNSRQFQPIQGALMPDLAATASFVLLFLLAILYVHGCDRLKGAR